MHMCSVCTCEYVMGGRDVNGVKSVISDKSTADIGQNTSCALSDWLTSRPGGCSQPRELWFSGISGGELWSSGISGGELWFSGITQ